MNIVITGFMGTGKSSAGKLLARKLGWLFFDTDEMIEKEVGLKISEIFSNRGEPYFRNVESKAVSMVSMLNNAVISCGGGVVLNSANMDELGRNGVIVNLSARPEKILEFTKANADRPLLNVQDPLAAIKELLKMRAPYYKRCHFSLDTSDMTVEQIADKILENPLIKTKIKTQNDK
ncbi:MAG: hypothetical protein JW871_00510 [Endomicrobiales bacterium]|nr:hypothetical protein [Endomicrobiales bacterium]